MRSSPEVFTALLVSTLFALTLSCGADTRGTPTSSEGIASAPTVPVAALEPFTADEVLSKAIEALENASSFEVEGRQTIVDENGTNSTRILVRKSSQERIYGLSEHSERVDEEILFDGKLYDRNAKTLEQLQNVRWEVWNSRQTPSQYFDIAVVLSKLVEPQLSIDESQASYVLN